MFTVTGTIESVGYRVGVQDEVPEGAHSLAMGSDNVMALLDLSEGESVQASPTSDPVVLDLTDGATILAFLRGRTVVSRVEGDAPAEPDPEPGVIY